MTKSKILEYFNDINEAYNNCNMHDTLKRMLDKLEPEINKSLEKQKAISELQPPTDNWETYANRLYDLAYLSGYNDGLIAKGNLWGNTNE